MRTTHLSSSWGLAITLLLGTSFAATSANAAVGGIELRVSKMPFTQVVRLLAEQSGMQLVLQTDIDTPVSLNYPNPTPLEKIMDDITKPLNLDFWKSGDTFYIGKRKDIQIDALIDPIPPKVQPIAPPPATTPGFSIKPSGVDASTYTGTEIRPVRAEEKSVTKLINLEYTSAREMEWLLGKPGATIQESSRRNVMRNRIKTILDSRNPQQIQGDAGSSYSSPGATTPWLNNLSGSVSRDNSATNGNQFTPFQGGGQGFGAGMQPGGGGGDPGFGNAAMGPGANANANAAGGNNNGLSAFLPEGIEQVVGLIGLNAILVKANNQEAIDQLEQLIKLLDKPVKQVIVEVMFVKMTIQDALALGSAWEINGMPLSFNTSNPQTGNFNARYVKGNIRASLSSMIQTSQAKVVNAPRVVVQNGGTASIHLTDSMPFVMVPEDTDVFGRTSSQAEIGVQEFDQGLDVDQVLIHPDDSVTLYVNPVLSAPSGETVGIPGGSGEIQGSNAMEIDTILRVKSGETVMMGGFVSRNETEGGTRTPLLSNIPLLGPLLFKSSSISKNNTEIMVFLTPTIMKDDTTDFGGMGSMSPLF